MAISVRLPSFSLSDFFSSTRLKSATIVMLALLTQACAVTRLGENLSYGVLDNDDIELVGEGLPTYLLMIDGMIVNWPESESFLQSGASLYSAYAGIYVSDPERAQRLTTKAMGYALRAACANDDDWCDVRTMPIEEFDALLADAGKGDVPAMYVLGSTWVGYIQQNSGDWSAVGELGRVDALMQRVVELEEGYEFGQAHMYLGALNSILPASLGGNPDLAKSHFDQAVSLSDGRNLLAKTLCAERYARMVFDQSLHDQLLREVLEADPNEHGLTLQNRYAQREAQALLDGSAEYFE
jgi:TRAP transporter TatT component family protein